MFILSDTYEVLLYDILSAILTVFHTICGDDMMAYIDTLRVPVVNFDDFFL